MRKFSKKKQKNKLYIKSLKSENPEDELIYKNYKKLLEKLGKSPRKICYSKNTIAIRKTQG